MPNLNIEKIIESLREGEYYIWKLNFQDGTSKNVRIKWDETSKEQLESHFKKPIADIEYSWGVHSDGADELAFRRDFKSQNPLDRNISEGDSDFTVGNTIRTNASGITGVIEKIIPERKEVHFRMQDGRLMKTNFNNVTTVEKLADEDDEIMEAALNEISNEVLTKYKASAGKAAAAADKQGDFKTGNKRFSGIVNATKKQFDNDTKSAKAAPVVADKIHTKTGDKSAGKQTQQTYEERLREFVDQS